jgi:hypothetical protein
MFLTGFTFSGLMAAGALLASSRAVAISKTILFM